ncbi:MAG: polyphosphate:AMP phosphotransferase [Oscillospiraceae bacterium]
MLENLKTYSEHDVSKTELTEMSMKLSQLEQTVKTNGIPVIILFEGWSASGKGEMISRLIRCWDPRSFKVLTIRDASEDEKRRPFMYRFWKNIPPKGMFSIMDRSWYRDTVHEYMNDKISKNEFYKRIQDINTFERQLSDDGYVIIKFFLNVSRDEQKKRIDKLQNSKLTEWRVNKNDINNNKNYDSWQKWYDKMMTESNTAYCPWHIIAADEIQQAVFCMYDTIIKLLEAKASGKSDKFPQFDTIDVPKQEFPVIHMPKLSEIDLSKSFPEDMYREELKEQQKILSKLHNKCYIKKKPVIICYEGWDAGGKGGNIRRVTNALDPRGYEVIPISAPDKQEISKHYLWRFWNKLNKDGHFTIFDRTWYGRVMVERIEGFTPLARCDEAYQEINEFEKQLADWGTVIVKFWLHIDKDEQLARFTLRQNTPEKQWKITEEDWRNREKWDAYESAVDEMIEKTSTEYAPWTVIEGNDKKFARIKAIKTINEAIRNSLE